jgi:hypothetical protein
MNTGARVFEFFVGRAFMARACKALPVDGIDPVLAA